MSTISMSIGNVVVLNEQQILALISSIANLPPTEALIVVSNVFPIFTKEQIDMIQSIYTKATTTNFSANYDGTDVLFLIKLIKINNPNLHCIIN